MMRDLMCLGIHTAMEVQIYCESDGSSWWPGRGECHTKHFVTHGFGFQSQLLVCVCVCVGVLVCVCVCVTGPVYYLLHACVFHGDACSAVFGTVLAAPAAASQLLTLNWIVTVWERCPLPVSWDGGFTAPLTISGHFWPKHLTWTAQTHIIEPKCCGFQIWHSLLQISSFSGLNWRFSWSGLSWVCLKLLTNNESETISFFFTVQLSVSSKSAVLGCVFKLLRKLSLNATSCSTWSPVRLV